MDGDDDDPDLEEQEGPWLNSSDDHDQCDKPCDFYDDVDCAKECHHDNFLDVIPLKIKYGAQVKTCCSSHQYFFHDYCEVN